MISWPPKHQNVSSHEVLPQLTSSNVMLSPDWHPSPFLLGKNFVLVLEEGRAQMPPLPTQAESGYRISAGSFACCPWAFNLEERPR